MDIEILKKRLPELLPKAVSWAESVASTIINQGMPLDVPTQADARKVGVNMPEKVRILEVDAFPLPADPELNAAATLAGLLSSSTIGLTLGYGILIARGERSRRLLSHECRHVHQYEQAGSIAAFLPLYLTSVLLYGYVDSPYETDARQHELA